MIICSDGHDEVAFEGQWDKDCPACSALEMLREEIKAEMQGEIDELQKELDEHECE